MRQNGSRPHRRIVITGMGAVTPIGLGVPEFWTALLDGKSGIREITSFDASKLPSRVAGEVRNFHVREFIRQGRKPPLARFSAFAVAAARLAVSDAKLPSNGASVGVCIGSSVQGNADIGEAAFAKFRELGWQALGTTPSLEVAAHSASSYVQGELQVRGPLMTIASACCTGIAFSAAVIAATADMVPLDPKRACVSFSIAAPMETSFSGAGERSSPA